MKCVFCIQIFGGVALGSLAISILILTLRTLDFFFFNVQKTNWTAVSKRYQRMIVTVSITETFVIQLWSLLLMLTMFESSLIKKLNLITLNLLGASFDSCFRLYCQMHGVNVKVLHVLTAQLPLLLLASNSLLIGREIAKNSERNKTIKKTIKINGHAGSSVCSLNPDHFLSCVRPGTFVWRSISNLRSDHSLGFAPSNCYS